MKLFQHYCKSTYYSEFDSSSLLSEIQTHIDSDIIDLSKEFLFIFYKMLHTDPCSYWDKTVYTQTIAQLENLFQKHGTQLEIDEQSFNYFLMGYNAYCQISETMVDLHNFNLANEIKTRLYRLPTYTAILESCLSNFLRVIAILTGKGIGKDYSAQNTLKQLLDVVSSNGYNSIEGIINVNIRNAINHGKVIIKKGPTDQICFYYTEQHIQKCQEMPLYEFDRLVEKAYDCVSAILLALAIFINRHLLLLRYDETKAEYVPFSILAMQLSFPGVYCQGIHDTGIGKQLNVEIEIKNTDRAYIAKIAILLCSLVFEKYNSYNQYLFSFSSTRMATGWVRFQRQDILDMIENRKKPDAVISRIIGRKDFMIFPPSTEEIDLNEIKYFSFPNYSAPNFKINNVQDASTLDRKRLKANLYIGDICDKEEILSIIRQAIEWIVPIKNPASPFFPQKHGSMPADSVYINVYRTDGRKSKELFVSNDNFVCFVDYNLDDITTLEHGGVLLSVWNTWAHEHIDNIRISWRERCYLTRRTTKIGRNDPCPCGSGLKYKKCCGREK